jgi:hypothetical protein
MSSEEETDYMKRFLFVISVLFFILFTTTSYSQNTSNDEESSGLQFKSLTHAIGFYNLEKLKGKTGLSVSFQATFEINDHLLASSFAVGFGVSNEDDILKNLIHSFVDINVLYGREFEILDNLYVDIFTGVGYLEQTKLKNNNQGVSLNIPVRAKLMFAVSNRIKLGALSQFNFNSKNEISMYQFFVQIEL